VTGIDENLRTELEKIAEPVFTQGANGRPRFAANRLAKRLRDEAPFAVGGELLFRYRDGAYRPDGEEWARRRIIEELGDDWTRARADEVIAYLRDSASRLLERPPQDIVNCRNGLLEVETRKLRPHDPDLLTPVQIGAGYAPGASCPVTERFVDEAFPRDAAVLMAEIAGYIIVPDNGLQTAIMLLGAAGNGKSTWLAQLRALAGEENVSSVPLHKLDEDRFAVASLYGKLVNIFADLDARALRSSSIFKSVTGGDALHAERKFRAAFSFVPYARLIFSANAAPPTSDSSDAFFRRWLIIPFERRFTGPDRELGFERRLTTHDELSGLLNLALDGLEGLRLRGDFTNVESAARANEKFRVDSDSVAGFLEEQCEVSPEAEVSKSTLALAYREWCKDNGRMALSTRRFNDQLTSLRRDLGERTVTGDRRWVGIGLRRAL
jgi:putative DNA primase/helicase